MPTMSKCYHRPQGVKNDSRSDQSIYVKLAEILHGSNPTLVCLVNVLLKTAADIFKDLVHDRNRECRMVSLQVVRKHSQKVNTAILNLPGLGEHVVKCASRLFCSTHEVTTVMIMIKETQTSPSSQSSLRISLKTLSIDFLTKTS